MASLRNPASACSRFLMTPSGRTASPDRWHCQHVAPDRWHCQHVAYRSRSTIHQVHDKEQTEKKTTTSTRQKAKSYMQILTDQVSNIERLKDNVISGLSSVSVLTTDIPSRLTGEFQKYIPFKTKQKIQRDNQKEQLSILDKIVRDRARKSVPTNADQRGENLFEAAMQNVNESVVGFFRNTAEIGQEKEKNEEDDLVKQFQSIPDSNRKVNSVKKKPVIQRDFVSRKAIEIRTRSLVEAIKTASTLESQLRRSEDFCKHIQQHPNSRSIATKDKVVPFLLKFRNSPSDALASQANEALALIGYVDPVKGRGIRILAIDGGGTRGLLAIETMKYLEQRCGMDIRNMFDYVCGVSTGSLIVAMIFLYRVPLNECEKMYKDFSRKMFTRNKVIGTSNLVWSHAFYDSEFWEDILKTEIGYKRMSEFARDRNTPKYCAMSTVMNASKLKNFIFRDYNLPPHTYSTQPGSCNHRIWEVIRASTAAPGYFEEFTHGDYVHQDGGLMTNNPTAIAIQESRLLWPNESIQCVISLGTGRYEPAMELNESKIALKDKVMKIVDSATDTEAVHGILHDLLPQKSYYRFNPYLSEFFFLDEIRPEKIEQMTHETHLYLRKNESKMMKAIHQLSKPRLFHQRAVDKISEWVNSVRT